MTFLTFPNTPLWTHVGTVLNKTHMSDVQWALLTDECVLCAADQHIQFNMPLGFKDYKDIYTMGTKKNDNTRQKIEWKGFINVNLTKAEKSDVIDFFAKKENNFDALIDSLVSTGHSLTLSYDTKNKCFMVAMRVQDVDIPYAGYCITSRASEPRMAFKVALYKHYAVLKEDWLSHVDDDAGWTFG